MEIIYYLCLGIGAGLLSGLLGIGGGIILVPALIFILGHNVLFNGDDLVHISAGTSLATVVFTSLSSAYAYHRHKALVWPIFWQMIPGLCVGLGVGKFLTTYLSNRILANLLTIFLIAIAFHLLQNAKPSQYAANSPVFFIRSNHKFSLKNVILISASILIGFLSALFGIGGGILMVPIFLAMNLSIREASGTSVLCGFIVALIGTILLSNTPIHTSIPYTTGYIYWPAVCMISISSVLCAPLGTHLAFRLNIVILKRLFALILVVSALNLWLTAL